MKLLPLTNQVAAFAEGATHVAVVDHTDLTQATANTAQVIPAFTAAAGDLVRVVGTHLGETFEDTEDAAFNSTALTIGDAGSANRFLASQQLNENGTEVISKAGEAASYAYNTATAVNLTFGSMSAKSLSDINKGKLYVYFSITKLPRLHVG